MNISRKATGSPQPRLLAIWRAGRPELQDGPIGLFDCGRRGLFDRAPGKHSSVRLARRPSDTQFLG